jgi:hypothetical protein
MNGLIRFLQTTIVGGIVILVPVILLVVLVGKVLRFAERLAQPLASFLPLDTAAGIVVANLILLFVAALACFGAGLIARGSLASRAVQKAESKFLWNVPGYVQFKAIVNSLNPTTTSRAPAPSCVAPGIAGSSATRSSVRSMAGWWCSCPGLRTRGPGPSSWSIPRACERSMRR